MLLKQKTNQIEQTADTATAERTIPSIEPTTKSGKLRFSSFIASIIILPVLGFTLPSAVFDLVRMGGQECSKPDLITGFMHLPNKKIVWKQEGYSEDATNSQGFLDNEHKIAKDANIFRIAMLGDSQTESLQVPQQLRFSNQLAARLNEEYVKRGKETKIEVLNCGISAAGTGQELLTYLRYVKQYKPDVTVLFYDSGDEDKNQRKPVMAQWYPHVVFGLDSKGQLIVSWRDFDSWLHSAQAMPIALFETLRRDSRMWGVAIQEFTGIKTNPFFIAGCTYLDRWHLLTPIEDALTATFPVSKFGPQDFQQSPEKIGQERASFALTYGLHMVDRSNATPIKFDKKEYEFGQGAEYHTLHLTQEQQAQLEQRYHERWQVTLAILKRLSEECKKDGGTLVVVGFPPQLLKDGFQQTFTQITDLATQEGFLAENFTAPFDMLVNAKHCEPRYVTHLTPAGHEVMTELLVDYLKRKDLLPVKSN
ncbi:MAG TPA: SGNH/GDSL hydrolase family protein [Oculatellaceae cyanobacterium]